MLVSITYVILRVFVPLDGTREIRKLVERAKAWWLEIDEKGAPQREIGFDESGTPIIVGPIADYQGYLIDASDDWSASTEDSAEARKNFEREWEKIAGKFKLLK